MTKARSRNRKARSFAGRKEYGMDPMDGIEWAPYSFDRL